jgi:hypothetical protein
MATAHALRSIDGDGDGTPLTTATTIEAAVHAGPSGAGRGRPRRPGTAASTLIIGTDPATRNQVIDD